MPESQGDCFCPGGNAKFGENTADVRFNRGRTYGEFFCNLRIVQSLNQEDKNLTFRYRLDPDRVQAADWNFERAPEPHRERE